MTRRFHWLVRTLITVVVQYIAIFGIIIFVLPAMLVPAAPESTVVFLLSQLPSLMMPAVTIGLIWLLMRHVDRRPLGESGLSFGLSSLPLLLLGCALNLGLCFGTVAALGLGERYTPAESHFSGWMLWTDLIVRALIHASFCEELLFRGYLMQTLPFRSAWARVAVSAVAFGAIHMTSSGSAANIYLYALQATGFAFLAGALVVAFRSIWPAVGVHLATYLLTDALRAQGWGEGPDTWLASGVAGLLAGCLVLLVAGRRPLTDPFFPVRETAAEADAEQAATVRPAAAGTPLG